MSSFHVELTRQVKELARQAGFGAVGIAPAGPLPDYAAARLRDYLARGLNATMAYLGRDVDTRLDPSRLLPAAQSVICLATSYAPAGDDAAEVTTGPRPVVARYARGADYHEVLKRRAIGLMDDIRRIAPGFEGRAMADAGPIAERSLAVLAGLGFIGRNGCLIVPGLGSYVVLCEIVCNLPLAADEPVATGCGDCRACLDACPSGALTRDGYVEAARCVSYLTQAGAPIDEALLPAVGNRLLGCDACQQVCPHNRGLPAGDPEFAGDASPGADLAAMLDWTPQSYASAVSGLALGNLRYERLLRNAAIVAGNSGDTSLAAPLERLRRRMPQLAGVVDWALKRLGVER